MCFNGSFTDVDNRLTSRDTSAITNGQKRRYVGANRWETHTVCFNGSFKDLHNRLTSRDTSAVKKRQKTSVWACVKYVPKQSVPKHFEHELHQRFGHV